MMAFSIVYRNDASDEIIVDINDEELQEKGGKGQRNTP